MQEFFGQVIQPPLRYFHEERTDVYFQDIAIPRVVLGAEPDMFFHPFYAVERTLSLAGTVTVIDELLFQKRNEPVGYEVVYNTVAEVGGENLPFHGFVDNESDGTRRAVCAGIDFPPQFHTPAFVIALEGKGIAGIAFLLRHSKYASKTSSNGMPPSSSSVKRLCCNSISLYHFVYRKVFIEKAKTGRT